MNSLSWFLYWIGVLDSLQGIAAVSVFLLIGSVVLLWIAVAMRLDDTNGEEKKQAVRVNRNAWTVRLVSSAAIVALISVFVPSKNTMYAIAASEAGERVAKSEAVQGIASDAQKALQIWIKRQIEPDAKK